MEMYLCWLFGVLTKLAGGEYDANRLLHPLKYARGDLRLMSLRRAVNDPYLTAVMIASEIPAAISPYSMAVAPDSSARNFLRTDWLCWIGRTTAR